MQTIYRVEYTGKDGSCFSSAYTTDKQLEDGMFRRSLSGKWARAVVRRFDRDDDGRERQIGKPATFDLVKGERVS